MRIVGSAFFVIGGHNILGRLATAKSEAAAENEGNAAQRSELPATYRGGGFKLHCNTTTKSCLQWGLSSCVEHNGRIH